MMCIKICLVYSLHVHYLRIRMPVNSSGYYINLSVPHDQSLKVQRGYLLTQLGPTAGSYGITRLTKS
jgi:hypothetical protein